MAALNSDWRGKAGPTAIPGPLELGDIVTSVETAARQAAQHGHSLAAMLTAQEQLRVIST